MEGCYSCYDTDYWMWTGWELAGYYWTGYCTGLITSYFCCITGLTVCYAGFVLLASGFCVTGTGFCCICSLNDVNCFWTLELLGNCSLAFCIRLLISGCIASFAWLALCTADSRSGLSLVTPLYRVAEIVYVYSGTSSSYFCFTAK